MNGHRSAFDGRNFEYYSEDSVLAGYIGASSIAGAQSYGVYAYMKHFALNDCEQDRIGLGVWLSEQAAREVYLKALDSKLLTTFCICKRSPHTKHCSQSACKVNEIFLLAANSLNST